jgi:hypothetical protein
MAPEKSLYLKWWSLRDAMRAVLRREKATPQQRKTLMADLEDYCGASSVPMVADKNGATDMYQTGKLHGRQEVLLYLRQILDLDDQTLQNMKELEDGAEEQ